MNQAEKESWHHIFITAFEFTAKKFGIYLSGYENSELLKVFKVQGNIIRVMIQENKLGKSVMNWEMSQEALTLVQAGGKTFLKQVVGSRNKGKQWLDGKKRLTGKTDRLQYDFEGIREK